MAYVLRGNHPSIQKIRELVTMVADTAFNVLLLGETGTGKEVIAHLLHSASSRRENRFIKVNCAALPQTLLESELFGHERGAFTGADRLKPGKFELASNGVIFLDEIGDMPMSLQTKLLHVLQNGEFTRLGGTKNIKVNAWIITSTNHDLEQDMKQGYFREDLYYRMNIIKVEPPPLRERKEDIPVLIDHFIQKHQEYLNIDGAFTLSEELRSFFMNYHWPGNIRELSSSILRLMIGDDPEVLISEFVANMKVDEVTFSTDMDRDFSSEIIDEEIKTDNQKSLKEVSTAARRYIEKKAIEHVLDMTGWNKRKTSTILKISYKTLFNKIADYGIERG
jgi:transcriptional regulator with PAS, ATPase and Fis domain